MPLCDLSRHQNSVNVVRWSPDGRILASGDTDSAIFLWQFDPNSTVPNLFGEESNMEEGSAPQRENWTILRILRGHLQVLWLRLLTSSKHGNLYIYVFFVSLRM